MKKPIILILIAVVVLGAVGVGISLSQKPTDITHQAHAAGHNKDIPKQDEIFIQDFSFNPKTITIKKGTTITWTNKDDAHHDINPDMNYGSAFTASKLLGKGESYSFTFRSVGTYNYHCSPHPYMKATVEVTE